MEETDGAEGTEEYGINTEQRRNGDERRIDIVLGKSGRLLSCGASDERTERRANAVTGDIIAAAIVVHRVLGPGLLESAYLPCLHYEMAARRTCASMPAIGSTWSSKIWWSSK